MTTADVTTVRDILRNKVESASVLANHPFHPEVADFLTERLDGQLELPLFDGNGDDLVRKWRSLPVRHKSMKQGQAVFPAGNTDRDSVIRSQHFKAPHGAPHLVQDSLFRVHGSSLPVTDATSVP